MTGAGLARWLIGGLVSIGCLSGLAAQDVDGASVSRRSLERLRFECKSSIHRRDLTLFANGTLRLRQGVPGDEAMWLVELPPEELEAFLRRLKADDRREVDPSYRTVVGDWIERCRLVLQLVDGEREEFAFGRFDTLPLSLQRTVAIASELIERVDTSNAAEGADRLPTDYQVEIGDELRRRDGQWFTVNGFTVDGRGVELVGLEIPLTLYVQRSELGQVFETFRRRPRYGR